MPPHVLATAAQRFQREMLATGLIVHTTYAIKEAGANPALTVSEGLRRLRQATRFAESTFLRPEQAGEPAGIAIREQLQLVERALADGKPAQVGGHVNSSLAHLQQSGATQEQLVEALEGLFGLIQQYIKSEQGEPLPQRSALVAVLRRLRSYDELARWASLQLQPLLEVQRGMATPRQLVHSLVARVHSSYADDISLQSYGSEHGVSLAYFLRLFKDEVGMTFSDYLTKVRVEKAKELLARGDLRPAEISPLVGYEDPKYFSQIFRRAAGMSPLDYQRSHRR